MQGYVSDPLRIPALEQGAGFARADLVFYGVDHSGRSHAAEIFFDNPQAEITTPRDPESGYAGWFTVFGHGGCFGAEGHCDVNDRHSDAFDRRPPHPLVPLTIAVSVTEAVRRLRDSSVVISIVPIEPSADGPQLSDALHFDSLRLITYAGYEPTPR